MLFLLGMVAADLDTTAPKSDGDGVELLNHQVMG